MPENPSYKIVYGRTMFKKKNMIKSTNPQHSIKKAKQKKSFHSIQTKLYQISPKQSGK